MANLKNEYTDVKDHKHKVEHHIVSVIDDTSRKQIVHELSHVLSKFGKRIPA